MNHCEKPKLIVFDMDGTLIVGRSIFKLAQRFNFTAKLEQIMSMEIAEYQKTKRIAALLKGISTKEIIDTFNQIPLSPGTEVTLLELKRQGHALAIISDSYTIIAEQLRKRLGFDYIIANELTVKDGEVSGEIEMPLNWASNQTKCLKHSVCKLNALIKLSEQTKIPLSRTIAIGDNTADICMLKSAGLGVAFNPKTPAVAQSANATINEDMTQLLAIMKGFRN